MRIGLGYDSHRFAEGRPLVLGGVPIPFGTGLTGHSDADAVVHAVMDALLGAAGLGDIGGHFPPDDPAWEDADSIELLARVVRMLGAENYQAVNVDVTVVCEAPRLADHISEMRARIADAIDISVGHVSVKATSNEKMGWIGRGEGIAALAAVVIDRMAD